MDRIMLGRSLILHIKCFYIGSVIPIRREPSVLLSMWLTGCCDPQRTQILSKKSLLKKKKLQLKKMMNRNCQQWRRSETCLGCFFFAMTLSCVCCRVQTSKCMWIFPAYFVSQSRHHFVFDYGDVAILNQCHYEVIPQQTLVLGTSWYHVCRWRFQRVVL